MSPSAVSRLREASRDSYPASRSIIELSACRECADLVRSRQVEWLAALARGDPVSECRKLGQRPRDVAHQREQQRREQRRRREHREAEPERGTSRRRRRVLERGDGDERRVARVMTGRNRLVHRHARHGVGQPEGIARPVPGRRAAGQEIVQRSADRGGRAERDAALAVEQREVGLLQRGEAAQQLRRIGQPPGRKHRRGVARLPLHALLERLGHDAHADGPGRHHGEQQRSEQRKRQAPVQGGAEGHAPDATAGVRTPASRSWVGRARKRRETLRRQLPLEAPCASSSQSVPTCSRPVHRSSP